MGRALYTRAAVAVLAVGVAIANGQQIQRPVDGADQKPHPYQTLQVELSNTIRANKAKVGDAVRARTVTALILPGQIVVPEGTKVIGRVTRVDFSPSGSGPAAICISFDKFQMRRDRSENARFAIRAGLFSIQGGPQPMADPSGGPAVQPVWLANSKPPRNANTVNSSVRPVPKSQTEQEDDVSRPEAQQDLRAIPAGTLLGMPGVSLQLDEQTGAATFRSADSRLELKSGLQLMLGVDPVKTASGETGNSQQK